MDDSRLVILTLMLSLQELLDGGNVSGAQKVIDKIIVESSKPQPPEEDDEANEGMSDAQLDSLLETLARLVDATAQTPADAARIIRDAKPRI